MFQTVALYYTIFVLYLHYTYLRVTPHRHLLVHSTVDFQKFVNEVLTTETLTTYLGTCRPTGSCQYGSHHLRSAV